MSIFKSLILLCELMLVLLFFNDSKVLISSLDSYFLPVYVDVMWFEILSPSLLPLDNMESSLLSILLNFSAAISETLLWVCRCSSWSRHQSILFKVSTERKHSSSLGAAPLKLSKPNITQLKATLKQLALELDIAATWNPPPPPTNFLATSRPARELKFGTDT